MNPLSPTDQAVFTPSRPSTRGGRQRRAFVVGLIAILVLSGVGVGMAKGLIPWPGRDSKTDSVTGKGIGSGDFRPTVRVVRPRKDPSVRVTAEQIATVEPYYRADLRARASGLVKRVTKDIGSPVKMGDLLVEIDVPESIQDVAQKAAGIAQRERERAVAEAKSKEAQAALLVAAESVKQRQAEVTAAEAVRDFRKKRYERFRDLAARGSAVGNVVEEEERDFRASEASLEAARAAVEKARADSAEVASKAASARADIELKDALIDVARKEWERAKVVADFGKITAPFDGVVIRRNVDPGSFVQNATSGSSESLISIARTDVVSVVAKFPDNVAPYVGPAISAAVVIDERPDLSIAAKVTRYSPSIQNSDRTMRVEVDLFNGTAEEMAASRTATDRKGDGDPPPHPAFVTIPPGTPRLIPGMTGTIRLTLGTQADSYVLPSTAVYSRLGKPYILVVENGVTRQRPVAVPVSDGRLSKVLILSERTDSSGTREVLTELTGSEEVVIARQLEIGNGTAVRTSVAEDNR